MRSNSAPVFPPPRVTHSSVCVSVSSSDGVLVASSVSVSVPPPLPAQRNSLPVQSATATLAQAEKMKEIDKYCENVQVCAGVCKPIFAQESNPDDTEVLLACRKKLKLSVS